MRKNAPQAAEVLYVTDMGEVIPKMVDRPYPDRIRTSCPDGSKFVIRYARRLRKWEAYRIRDYVSNPSTGQFYRAPPPAVTHPNRDSVIGFALIMP